MKKILVRPLLVFACLVVLPNGGWAQAPLVNVETVLVGDAGNTADTAVMTTDGTSGYGSVSYEYRIGKYEVTTGQYATFLNAVAAMNSASYITDLWNPSMQLDLVGDVGPTITRSGLGTLDQPFVYFPVGDTERPVVYVNWFAAARFANWINNGAMIGSDTETGAYTLNGATNGVGIARNDDAVWWIPTEDEWYKAAYYKGGGTDAGYWLYPTQSETAPTAAEPPSEVSNTANYNSIFSAALSSVGSYSNSASSFGTFDQGGNVFEITDTVVGGTAHVLRGGAFFSDEFGLQSTTRYDATPPDSYGGWGFRLATVPEPSTYALLFLGGAASLWALKRRKS